MNISRVVGIVLSGIILFHWRYVLTPLSLYSVPLRFSIPMILGLFLVWLLSFAAAIACFFKPLFAFRLLIVAVLITLTSAVGGAVINRDPGFLKLFTAQTVVLLAAALSVRISNIKRITGAA